MQSTFNPTPWTLGPGKRVVLTGGAGFIGSHCLQALLKAGVEVIVVDAFDTSLYPESLKRRNMKEAAPPEAYTLETLNILDRTGLDAMFERHAPVDAVLHLAALAGVRPSIEQSPNYYDVNLTGTAHLLQAARARGTERFVLASSSSVYGRNTKTPFAETDRVDGPASPYAASKRAMELLAYADQAIHGGHITCLRLFTVYGPRQRPEMAIHKFMRLIDQEQTLPMFGDGQSGRDYTYVADIVHGIQAALVRMDGFRIYNLGGDRVVRLRHLIESIATVVGKPPQIEQLPEQPGDVPLTMADLTLARHELRFEPQTTLDDGLKHMWHWYRSVRS
ncbi:MAG: GDP-mannose 4,6-dehydratase [Myxococcota bacterium]